MTDRDAIRKRAAEGLVTTSEVVALLDEVERLGLSCPVVGHDAPVEPVPEGVVQQTVPIRCPHCARELRQAFDTLTENLEAAEDRERGWKIQTQIAESEVASLTARLRAGEDVIAFYADPLTYIAVGFVVDPPCGAFADDFDRTEYGAKPGKRARAFLDVAQAGGTDG